MLSLLPALLLAVAAPQERTAETNIGIVIDGPWERGDVFLDLVRARIEEIARDSSRSVRFPDAARQTGDWTSAGARRALAALLDDPSVDLVLALGPIASNEACVLPAASKPLVAAMVLDAQLQAIPNQAGTSGTPNLTYVTFPSRFGDNIDQLHELTGFQELTVLISEEIQNGIPAYVDRMRVLLQEYGRPFRIVAFPRQTESFFELLPERTDAVYLGPVAGLDRAGEQTLIDALLTRKIPAMASGGREFVERGVLASNTPGATLAVRAQAVAAAVQRILTGEPPESLATRAAADQRLLINMATARTVEVWPSFAIVTEAELLREEDATVQRSLSLSQVMLEAMVNNRDLDAGRSAVASGRQRVAEAASGLKPQVRFDSRWYQIDSDRSGFLEPQRTWIGALGFRQVLFSDRAFGALDVARGEQSAREAQQRVLELDVALEAAEGYLNLLRAKALERIQKDQLRTSRANLEHAQSRRRLGVALDAEIFRWESAVASDRQMLIDAHATRKQAEVELNRILHRPQEEVFRTEETAVDDPGLLDEPRLATFIRNQWDARIFRDFMVREGLKAAPEVQALEAQVAAQERRFSVADRARRLPELSFFGEVAQAFERTGLQSNAPLGDPFNWTAGLSLTFDVYRGGARSAGLRAERNELVRLRLALEAEAERRESEIRRQSHATSASFTNVELSREAARAARRNLEIVQDGYRRGVLAIVDLLDAQDAALRAERGAADASYDFLIDLLRMERSVGRFQFFESSSSREAWFQRLDAFYDRMKTERR